MVLATDGYYNCKSTFEQDILKGTESQDLNHYFNKLSGFYNDYIKDDASLLVLRRNDFSNENNFDMLSIYDLEDKIPKHILIEHLVHNIKQMVPEKDESWINEIISFVNEKDLLFSKEQIDEILKCLKDNDFMIPGIYNSFISLLRKFMKS